MKSDKEFLDGIYAKAEGILAMEQMAGQVSGESKPADNRRRYQVRRTAISVMAAAAVLLLCFIIIKPELFSTGQSDSPPDAAPMSLEQNTRDVPVPSGMEYMDITGTVDTVRHTEAELRISVVLTKESGKLAGGDTAELLLASSEAGYILPEGMELTSGMTYHFTVIERDDAYQVTAVWAE